MASNAFGQRLPLIVGSESHTKEQDDRKETQRTGHGPEEAAAFFRRNGYDACTLAICDQFARQQFPQCKITVVQPQGYCSYTLDIEKAHMLQFRPANFQLDLSTSDQARSVYGDLVPKISHVGTVRGISAIPGGSNEESAILHVYLQDRIPGIPLAAFRERMRYASTKETRICRRRLIEDVAQTFAVAFIQGRSSAQAHGQNNSRVAFSKGYVGSSLDWRLELLRGLEAKGVGRHVIQAQQALPHIEKLPWCLTHGDMVPANVMVDPKTGSLTGLIDWAEGEWLPFGVGLYGLEELLGEEISDKEFRYYTEHDELRRLFWRKFMEHSRYKLYDIAQLKDITMARRLGILLWRGLAFENGRIDRLVETGQDDMDICKLHMFLQADDGLDTYFGRNVKRKAWVLWLRNVWLAVGGLFVKVGNLWHKQPAARTDGHAVSKITSVANSSVS